MSLFFCIKKTQAFRTLWETGILSSHPQQEQQTQELAILFNCGVMQAIPHAINTTGLRQKKPAKGQ